MPDAASNPSAAPKPRRWSIIAAGLLLLALALVVIYTTRSAFSSPLALVVVAAIGLAALLLQLRLRKDGNAKDGCGKAGSASVGREVHAPLWLNVLGLAFAITAVAADFRQLHARFVLMATLGAVICFAISATAVLRDLRKKN